MIVESPSKKIYIGDHLNNNDTQHTSTNEKIIINEDEVEEGEYTIHMYGGAFADNVDANERQDQKVDTWISAILINALVINAVQIIQVFAFAMKIKILVKFAK